MRLSRNYDFFNSVVERASWWSLGWCGPTTSAGVGSGARLSPVINCILQSTGTSVLHFFGWADAIAPAGPRTMCSNCTSSTCLDAGHRRYMHLTDLDREIDTFITIFQFASVNCALEHGFLYPTMRWDTFLTAYRKARPLPAYMMSPERCDAYGRMDGRRLVSVLYPRDGDPPGEPIFVRLRYRFDELSRFVCASHLLSESERCAYKPGCLCPKLHLSRQLNCACGGRRCPMRFHFSVESIEYPPRQINDSFWTFYCGMVENLNNARLRAAILTGTSPVRGSLTRHTGRRDGWCGATSVISPEDRRIHLRLAKALSTIRLKNEGPHGRFQKREALRPNEDSDPPFRGTPVR